MSSCFFSTLHYITTCIFQQPYTSQTTFLILTPSTWLLPSSSTRCPCCLVLHLPQLTQAFPRTLPHQCNSVSPSMAPTACQIPSLNTQEAGTNVNKAISVGWNTYQKLSKPCVQYGLTASSLTLQTCSTQSVTYASSRTWSNQVVLSALDAATTYYYKITSTNSTVGHFMTARTPGDMSSFNVDVVIDVRHDQIVSMYQRQNALTFSLFCTAWSLRCRRLHHLSQTRQSLRPTRTKPHHHRRPRPHH
jgi:hypothetical protein